MDELGSVGTREKFQVSFDAVYTVQEFGSYKPDIRNFEYMFESLIRWGIHKDESLHMAENMFREHVLADSVD